jgi:hypothetical protein
VVYRYDKADITLAFVLVFGMVLIAGSSTKGSAPYAKAGATPPKNGNMYANINVNMNGKVNVDIDDNVNTNINANMNTNSNGKNKNKGRNNANVNAVPTPGH